MKNPDTSNVEMFMSLFTKGSLIFAFIVVMSIIVAVCTGTASAADLEAQSLPTTAPTLTGENWYDCPLVGLYKQEICLSTGDARDFYLYVPEGTQPNQAVVHILVPSDYEVETFRCRLRLDNSSRR